MARVLHLICVSAFAYLCFASTKDVNAQELYVSAILDSDRFVLSDGSRVELIGVEAIEKFSAIGITQDMLRLGVDAESIRTKGSIAAAYVSVLLRNRKVTVSIQKELVRKADQNSQFIPAFLSVLDDEGRMEFLLNKKVVADGYAFVDPQTPAAFKEQFISLQKQAALYSKGLWATHSVISKEHPEGKVRSSEGADMQSRCGLIKGCVWVSGENTNAGYWDSAVGHSCPCKQ